MEMFERDFGGQMSFLTPISLDEGEDGMMLDLATS